MPLHLMFSHIDIDSVPRVPFMNVHELNLSKISSHKIQMISSNDDYKGYSN